jgi:type IV pilus assembly protein PilB
MREKNKKKLGEILIEEGLIDEHKLATALGQQRYWGKGKLGTELVKHGFIKEEDLARVLESQLGIKWLSLRKMTFTPEILASVPVATAKKYLIMPVALEGKKLVIATLDTADLQMLDNLGFELNKRIEPVISTESDIKWAIAKYYDGIDTAGFEDKNASMTRETFLPGDNVIDFQEEPAEKHTPARPVQGTISEARLDALIMLLNEKGLISEQELNKKISDLGK